MLDEGTLACIQRVIAGDGITGLDAIADAFATHIDGCSEFVFPNRQHLSGLPAVLLRIGNDECLAGALAFQFDPHTHRVALRHPYVAAFWLTNENLCAGNALQICTGKKSAQQ